MSSMEPLNPDLYKKLKSVFGGVSIINPGQKANIVFDYQPRIGDTTVVRWFVPGDNAQGEQYAVRCPYCKDHSKHLYISHTSYLVPATERGVAEPGKLLVHCFHGCFDNHPERWEELNRKLSDTAYSPVSYTEQEDDQSNQYRDDVTIQGLRSWAPAYQPLNTAPDDVLRYIHSRGYTPEYLSKFSIGWGPIQSTTSGKLLNGGNPFLIIPFIMNNRLKGFQARACMSKERCEELGYMRYYIHPGCRKSAVLYNIDRASASKVAVLTEGVFGVLRIGQCGIACFGHTPSKYQEKLMAARWSSGALIWVPDTLKSPGLDPIQKARDIVDRYNKDHVFALGAHVVILDAKDPDETSRVNIWKQINEQTGDLLVRKVWTN